MDQLIASYGAGFLNVVWDLVSVVGVPIAAAGVAAGVVVRQIRQLDRHRTEDRQAKAVLALTDLLTREAEVVLDPVAGQNPNLHWFRTNEALVRAYSLLPGKDAAVARWVAKQRDSLRAEVTLAKDNGEFLASTVGNHRAAALRTAAEAMEQLLEWQRGNAHTSWFEDRL